MNSAEYLFYQETKPRKQMLSGARGKVNGSKSKKCTLPSDYLTRSQKKKLNGEVKVYKMNSPMTWSEFKNMPVEHQEAYLAGLVNKYGVSYAQLGSMFGCTNTCVNTWVKKHNFTSVHVGPKGKGMTKEQKENWSKFLHNETSLTSSSYTSSTKESSVSSTLESESDDSSIMQVSSISMGFDGEIDFNDIIAYLKLALGDDPKGHLEISFRKQ